MNNINHKQLLGNYYRQVQDIILNRQHPVSGLLPASTAITSHGNYTDAWVRDNVYSILAVWGLALAYRRCGENSGRTYLLQQSVVKLMRGLLTAMMRQAHKVECFKYSMDPSDALHAKYNTNTGEVVVGDHEWGHLQLDATSLFLLMLAQMTASGLRIIFTLDEVNFVQNLVHYISRAYRTPDYGIWERGNKSNHGIAELNASSVGMAKAALEAMSGFNLFGSEGGQASVIHVIGDEIARTRIALESLLPRESISKEVDSAVLSIIGFPAFAVEDNELLAITEQQIREKLEGNYGCKRFLLDGHQTVLEDSHRLYYEAHELKQFSDVECEWPLFFCYLLLNKLYSGDQQAARDYRVKLDGLLVEQNDWKLLPELYWVPHDHIEAEKANPGSQQRLPNENIPLVWAQSLYILAALIQDGLLSLEDIDPIGRRHCIGRSHQPKVQLSLLAENPDVQSQLNEYGVDTQTIAEIAPIQVRDSGQLADAFMQIGRNERLGLSGRPRRQLRSLATSMVYQLADQLIVFPPQFLSQRGFYLVMDNRLLVERLRLELAYIHRHWDRPGHPLVIMVVKPNMLDNKELPVLLEFMSELQQGSVLGVPVQSGRLTDFIANVGYEKIDYLHDFRFPEACWQISEISDHVDLSFAGEATQPVDSLTINQWTNASDQELQRVLLESANLYAQFVILNILQNRYSLDHVLDLTGNGEQLSLRYLLEELYARVGTLNEWTLVRRCAGLLGKHDIDLEQSAAEILIRQKALTVGFEYSNRSTFKRPPNTVEILQTIRDYNSKEIGVHVVIQELIIYLGILIKSHPKLFTDMQTIRVGHIMQLIMARYRRANGGTLEDSFNALLSMPPHKLAKEVEETLADYHNSETELNLMELLRYEGQTKNLLNARFSDQLNPKDRGNVEDWHEWREQLGGIGREPESFYADVWEILQHCKGLMIGNRFKSQRLLDSEDILAQMTAREQSFVLLINHRLNKIQSADYRQLTVEALQALAMIFKDNPDLYVDDILMSEILLNHAVRITWLQNHPERADQYELDHALSWQEFYQLPPHEVANGIIDALNHLLDTNDEK